MASKRQLNRVGQGREQTDCSDKSVEQRLQELERNFVRFRRGHRPGTRIPQHLRDAALQALRCGASEQEVRRVCRVTAGQLQWWGGKRSDTANRAVKEPAVRFFPVIDDSSTAAVERGDEYAAAQQLELSIGGWSICIRHSGA